MVSISHQHRAWFALLKERGVADDDRHAVQEAHTGKASLRDWTPADYDRAIAALQRAGHQHADAHAHLRSERPERDAEAPATPEQGRFIEDLCDRIAWKTGRQFGPRRYACSTVLKGDANMPRRVRLRDTYDGLSAREAREAAWNVLTRTDASVLLHGLNKMARLCALDNCRSVG